MKTIITFILLLAVSLNLTGCSSDDEILVPVIAKEDSQDDDVPAEPLPNFEAVEIPGFPKSIHYYFNGNLYYWLKYYYRSDGNLLKVNYGHPEHSSEIFTDTYHYNTEGKLIKLEGHDVYNFHWDEDRIVGADKYNALWFGRSKIFYEYNSEGQIIQKTENNLDFFEREKIIYTYFEDGNLMKIEQYGDYHESGVFTLYFVTSFVGYKDDSNEFLEFVIIPGQRVQRHFPASMEFKHLTESGYDRYETYRYNYDAEGRVVEKIFGDYKVVYEYY
ncbi:hypothetical protein NE848_04285 [Gramella jeungdoensis]|uniref:DUF4595 domain-containing protein n=1 Tax=Gramella jeungdoensis TaxID=708091 RepID=A0ABT0YYP1_9FLAO|nr:hypothetical protein [Gramella jeungdoensis]MCM8568583.1 hypothetical protein [Gramella jeungdoensis]